MRLISTLFSDARAITNELLGSVRGSETVQHPRVLYAALDAYYHNSGLYDQLRHVLNEQGTWTPASKAVRNPAHAVVEFYVSTIASGSLDNALPIVVPGGNTGENELSPLAESIQTIWSWSNMQANKGVQTRRMALYGDKWWRVSTRQDRNSGRVTGVYEQPIWPGFITDFEADERGNVTYVRMDIPQSEVRNRRTERWTYTEEWSKDTGRFRTWKHTRGMQSSLDDLGRPETDEDIASFGIDFVPFVQAKFRDTGDDRGHGAFTHALDVIDEANQQATRLAQLLFRHNKPVWIASGGRGQDNRPMPPPRLSGNNDDTVKLDDDIVVGLSGDQELTSLIPNVNYEAGLRILQDTMDSLGQYYLPELAYYRLSEREDLSGRAIQLMLSAAISRVGEARGSFDGAIVRANKMALTMAAFHRLDGFTQYAAGAFDRGELDHYIADRDVIPLNDLEERQAESERMRSLDIKRNELGVPRQQIWKEVGYSDDEIQSMLQMAATEQAEFDEAAMRRFDRGLVTPDDDV